MSILKAVAIRVPSDGSAPEIVAHGRTTEVLAAARAAAKEIPSVGAWQVVVFSTEGRIWNDDGRKADYARRSAANEAAKAESPKVGLADEVPAEPAKKRGRPRKTAAQG